MFWGCLAVLSRQPLLHIADNPTGFCKLRAHVVEAGGIDFIAGRVDSVIDQTNPYCGLFPLKLQVNVQCPFGAITK